MFETDKTQVGYKRTIEIGLGYSLKSVCLHFTEFTEDETNLNEIVVLKMELFTYGPINIWVG